MNPFYATKNRRRCCILRPMVGRHTAQGVGSIRTCQPVSSVASAVFTSLALWFSPAAASEYCTKEQYQHDRELVENATKSGTLLEGPKGLRDSILVKEDMWFGMNYPQQIAFMQSFECSVSGLSGKRILHMDVRSLATGKLLATWFAGTLKPTENPTNNEQSHTNPPGMSPDMEDESHVGLTGQNRAAFIKSTIDECNNRSPAWTSCSCFADTLADSVSTKELEEASSAGNPEAKLTALRPKIEAALQRCRTN